MQNAPRNTGPHEARPGNVWNPAPNPVAPHGPDPLEPERMREIARIDRLAHLLDNRFGLPGTRIRFGLDSIVGLIPGIGDAATTVPSAWMIMRGWQLGARRSVLLRMTGNVAVDFVVGSIPLVGDLFDVGFKANLRNAALLRKEILRPQGNTLPRPMRDVTPDRTPSPARGRS